MGRAKNYAVAEHDFNSFLSYVLTVSMMHAINSNMRNYTFILGLFKSTKLTFSQVYLYTGLNPYLLSLVMWCNEISDVEVAVSVLSILHFFAVLHR